MRLCYPEEVEMDPPTIVHAKESLRLAVVMPVLIRTQGLWDATIRALRSVRIDRSWAVGLRAYLSAHVVVNDLAIPGDQDGQFCPSTLLDAIVGEVPASYRSEVIAEGDKFVAGAWNAGIAAALGLNAEYILVMANDVVLDPGYVETLVNFGLDPANRQVGIWSGIAKNRNQRQPGLVVEGVDFSAFMLRACTIERHGWFDTNFRPAYFEDNDYHARVVLGGQSARVIHDATFDHVGSLTIKEDRDQAHHVRYWFERNREYFERKWGRKEPAKTEEEIRQTYNPTPFGSGKPLYWWQETQQLVQV